MLPLEPEFLPRLDVRIVHRIMYFVENFCSVVLVYAYCITSIRCLDHFLCTLLGFEISEICVHFQYGNRKIVVGLTLLIFVVFCVTLACVFGNGGDIDRTTR